MFQSFILIWSFKAQSALLRSYRAGQLSTRTTVDFSYFEVQGTL